MAMARLPKHTPRFAPASRRAAFPGGLAVRLSIRLALVVVGLNLTARLALAQAPPNAPGEPVDFAQSIRPIFQQHCEKCHGEAKQESGLRLDRKQAALNHGDAIYGPPIVPGESAASVLLQAVEGTHAELGRMPPKGPGLSPDQIALLRAWIDQGANWPDEGLAAADERAAHWAFQPPRRPELPAVSQTVWAENPIDRFVLARLEAEGVSPAPQADRITLLRRLYLDLVGLGPSVAEVDEFLADGASDAYARAVERLLASPHFGERWGRHWLDAARYADSDGYEKDKSRQMWFYRDWVVGALNRDLPYDQFLIEQFAGDLLPGATQDQIVATGLLRNSMLNEEGGVDPEQFRMDAMFDRLDCVGKSVLGLTIQCAQCHNHKYDPITQDDYYALFAFLNNDYEPTRVVYTPDERKRIDELGRQMQAVEDEFRSHQADWQAQLSAWLADESRRQAAWTALDPDEFVETGGGAKLHKLGDGSVLCSGYAPTHCTFRLVAKSSLPEITGLRLDALLHPNLPCGGPGRSFKGTFYLTEIRVEAAPLGEPDKKTAVKLVAASADFSQGEAPLEPQFDDRSGRERRVGPVAWAIDGKDETAWGIDAGPGRRNRERAAVFQFETPVRFPQGAVLTVHLVQNHGGWNSDDHQNTLLGRCRLAVTGAESPTEPAPLPLSTSAALAKPDAERTAAEQAELAAVFRARHPQGEAAAIELESLWRQWPEGSTTLVLAAQEQPRTTHLLQRGDFLRPGKVVAPGVPQVLHPLPSGAPPTRLTLARWLVDRQSPTTARVIVNRVWQAYFGTGLVATPEDFGVQGEAPSHPELLDWLAVELMDQGWSLKHLHRLIVHSATYRQSSHFRPELAERDPYNRWLARGPRLRVEGEIVRDLALSASGLLNPALGGPSVFPPMPPSVLALSYGPMTWNAETGPNRYRRSLYTFRRRSIPFPALQNFDTPNGDAACVRRARSNTPLQALTTLNETLFIEAARALARRAVAEGGSSEDQRLSYAFRCCVSRPPEAGELAELRGLFERQRERLAQGWTNPWLLATGEAALPEGIAGGATPTELGAYTIVARVLLNLDETITKE